MEEKKNEKNTNLADPRAVDSPDWSNMPDNQVPRHRSNDNSEATKSKVMQAF